MKEAKLAELFEVPDPDFGIKTISDKDLILKVEKEFEYYE